MYVHQSTIFSFWDDQKLDRGNRLVRVLEVLNAEPLLAALERERKGRRNEYPLRVMWHCLVAGLVYRRPTVTASIEELEINPGLRRLCGITSTAGIPSAHAFSRFLVKLMAHEPQLDAMFTELVQELRERLPATFGERLAVDATDVPAWAQQHKAGEKTDPDARWGAKGSKHGGGPKERKYWWLGYKLHLVVDATFEIPIGYTVTPANTADSDEMVPLLKQVKQRDPALMARAQYITADKGYDTKAIYRAIVEDFKATPIIPLNLRREQEPPGICNHQGTPLCSAGLPMTFWGHDNGQLKWRCPAICHKEMTCPLRWPCCRQDGYGLVVKQSIRQDYRRFTAVPRETKKWGRLYAQRSSVERVNSRLKGGCLEATALTVRGIQKVRVRLGLGILVLVTGAVAAARNEQWDDLRRIVDQYAA